MFGRRIWKPWTIEVVGDYSGKRYQMTFWRFWTEESAEKKADELNEQDERADNDSGTHFEAAKVL